MPHGRLASFGRGTGRLARRIGPFRRRRARASRRLCFGLPRAIFLWAAGFTLWRPWRASVGSNLDCSSFIQYCYWACGLPYSASWTGAYATAGDLIPISASSVQPGDVRVVYSSGNTQGHVQMYVGGGSWIECAAGFGVGLNLSNGWMEARACHYFTYAGF